jgi:ComF family protein
MFRDLIDRAAAMPSSQCAVCRVWPTPQPVCEDCVAEFAQPEPRCHTCALPVSGGVARCGACVLAPPPLDHCLAGVGYAFPWQDLVMNFKFHDYPGWASLFALILQSMPGVESALADADVVLPMPLSKARLQHRGFNQALELARALDAAKTRARLLLRIKDTPAQSLLDRAARLTEVQGAFAVDPLRVAEIRGQRVVLVDDVMTSGATLFAAARAVRSAGAAHVTGLVFSRTPRE